MAYAKLISPAQVISTAVRMIEANASDGLSLRAVAASLGVKAPSLYRYFADKDALEMAVVDVALREMLAILGTAGLYEDAEVRFRATVEAYITFAKDRFALYSFIMHRVPQTSDSPVAKNVWNLLLGAASAVSGRPDDTGAAVAVWSFLHGYAMLQHSGAFGESGPKGGLHVGIEAFLTSFRR